MLWKTTIMQSNKKEKKKEGNNMWKCYFRNLDNGKEFSKMFESQYLMERFLTKCRYSKRIKCIGKVKQWV